MKKFISEFKAFITRGNILDMAVGVIIGGAFNTIVTTLNKQILMPVVNWALSYIGGGNGLYTILPNSTLATEADIVAGVATQLGPDGKTYTVLNHIDWSAFIESIINFFFIALTLFVILKVVKYVGKKRQELEDKLKKRNEEPVAEEVVEVEVQPEPEPTPDPVVVLLQEIRDSLKEKNLSDEEKTE